MEGLNNTINPFGAPTVQPQPPANSNNSYGMQPTAMPQQNDSFYQPQDPWNPVTSHSTSLNAGGPSASTQPNDFTSNYNQTNTMAYSQNPFLPQPISTGGPNYPNNATDFTQQPPQYQQPPQAQSSMIQSGQSMSFVNPISPASSVPSGSTLVISQFQSNPYASPHSVPGGQIVTSQYQSNPYASFVGSQQRGPDPFSSNSSYQQQGSNPYQHVDTTTVARVNPFDPFAPPVVAPPPPATPIPYPFPSPAPHFQNQRPVEFEAFPMMEYNRPHANSTASEPAIPQSTSTMPERRGSLDVIGAATSQSMVPSPIPAQQQANPVATEPQSTPSRPVRANGAETRRQFDEPVEERQLSLRPTFEYGQRADVTPDRNPKLNESPRNKYALELARQAPPGASPLPKADLVRKKGFVLSRISFRTIVMKKWKQSFWVQYGPHTMLWFRSQSDFDDWLNNPYHSQAERNFLIKLAVNFVHDLYKPNVRGYQVTQARTKGYGNKLVRQFKLERWMDYGPTIAAAFGSYNPKEVDDLREALVDCMRNTPLNNGIRATGAVRQRPPENINTQRSASPEQRNGDGHRSQGGGYSRESYENLPVQQKEPEPEPEPEPEKPPQEVDLMDMSNWDTPPALTQQPEYSSHSGQPPHQFPFPGQHPQQQQFPPPGQLPQQQQYPPQTQQVVSSALVPTNQAQAYPGAPPVLQHPSFSTPNPYATSTTSSSYPGVSNPDQWSAQGTQAPPQFQGSWPNQESQHQNPWMGQQQQHPQQMAYAPSGTSVQF